MMSRIGARVACIALVLAAPVGGQTCAVFVGEWGYGPTSSVASNGDIVLMDSGPKLLVVDLQTIPAPTVAGELWIESPTISIAMQGGVAFVITGYSTTRPQELLVIDVAVASRPNLLGALTLGYNLTDLAVRGDIAYVTSSNGGLTVIDVGDPGDLRIVNELHEAGTVRAIDLQGDHAYLASDRGVCAVDISNPAFPSLGACGTAGLGRDVAASQDLLFQLSYEGLAVFDISVPTDPRLRGEFTGIAEPHSVAAVGDTVYVTDWAGVGRLLVIDAEDPAEPIEIGRYQQSERLGEITLGGAHGLLVAGGPGALLLDVSDPSTPEVDIELLPPAAVGNIYDVAVRNDLAFLADFGFVNFPNPSVGRLRILDVSDGSAMTEIGTLELATSAFDVALYGEYVVVARGVEYEIDLGIEIVDVSDPTDPIVVGVGEIGGWEPSQLVVSGDQAFIANEDLVIVDLADPTRPSVLSYVQNSYYRPGFKSVAVVEDRAYLATSERGLCVVDVSDLYWPVELTCIPTLDYAHWVAAVDGRAYVTAGTLYGGENSLLIFDISDEDVPVQIGSFDLEGMGTELSVSDGLAFVKRGRDVVVVDVSDPAAPSEVGRVATSNGTSAIRLIGDRVFLTADPGLQVFDIRGCRPQPPPPRRAGGRVRP